MSWDAAAERLQAVALVAGADDLAAEARAVGERMREQRFYVACVGQFKRGKSTLLNALVGHSILPTGVLPVTSVPTILRFGPLGARVRTQAGWTSIAPDHLRDFVTEERNPGNSRGVLAAEVFLPAAVLQEGLCLVDTPGIGSIIEANSAATREFVPQIDAALVVLGADPPISGEELRLVQAIAPEVPTLLFVINKVDRVTDLEREQATAFLRHTLASTLQLEPQPVYQVSAVRPADTPDWATLVRELNALATAQRAELVGRAFRRGMVRIGRAVGERLQERRRALLAPVEESAHRVQALARLSDDAGRVLRELNPLFAAEEQRLSAEFAERAARFRIEAEIGGLAVLRAAWSEGRFDHASRATGLEFANQVARGLIYPWLERMEREGEAEYRAAAHRFAQLAQAQLAALTSTAGVDPARLTMVPEEAEAFRIRRHFAFSDRMGYHYPRSPWPALIDVMVPLAVRRRRRQRRAEAYLMDLLRVNTSRVAGDLAERVRESRREVEAEIRDSLRRISTAASEALEWARAMHTRGASEVRRECDRIESLLTDLEGILGPAGDRAA